MVFTVIGINPTTSMILVAIVACAKELYDVWIKRSEPDVIDFASTVFGGIIIFIYEFIKILY
jgi:hypothetical protein